MRAILAGLLAVTTGAAVAAAAFILGMLVVPMSCPANEGPYRSLTACVKNPNGPFAVAIVLGLIVAFATAFAWRRWRSSRTAGEIS
ncbi:MAG TPA: hypothetical protein VGG90_07800 [Candidatus Dormibacteraeota bacterium]